MKREEKDLLLRDLSARLPFGVKAKANDITVVTINGIVKRQSLTGYFDYDIITDNGNFYLKEVKPYLRPLSSMTDEEFEYLNKLGVENSLKCIEIDDPKESFSLATKFCVEQLAYLYKHHYDVFGLISADLALSTDEFNPYKE